MRKTSDTPFKEAFEYIVESAKQKKGITYARERANIVVQEDAIQPLLNVLPREVAAIRIENGIGVIRKEFEKLSGKKLSRR